MDIYLYSYIFRAFAG